MHTFATAKEYYRAAFFSALDKAYAQLGERLDKHSPGLKKYITFEQMLQKGHVDNEVCQKYPELNAESFNIQLKMFHNNYAATSLREAQRIFQNMIPEVRSLFMAVEKLLRLMLICPVSSCAAERLFSALRRLKNWLRNSMSQERLSAISSCYVNQTFLKNLNLKQLAYQFSQQVLHQKKCLWNCLILISTDATNYVWKLWSVIMYRREHFNVID